MKKKEAKKILKIIEKYSVIVISRHRNPDPDCLGSQIALRNILKDLYSDKQVYAVGKGANHLKYLGNLDTLPDIDTKKALAIILDTPDKKRIDEINIDNYDYSIKIDHHPFDHEYCNYEYIDATSSSTCEIILKLCNALKIEINEEDAERLYTGVVSDTERFLQSYTNGNTFKTVASLFKNTKLDITRVYDSLYLRPLRDYKIMSYIYNNVIITKNGFAYIKLSREWLEENKVDTQIIGKIAHCLNYIEEIISWCIITEEKQELRISLRSRGPIVNEIAQKYGGGGHKYISGVSLKEWEEVENIIKDLDNNCKEYKRGM